MGNREVSDKTLLDSFVEDARHLRIIYEETIDEKEVDIVKDLIRKHRLKR